MLTREEIEKMSAGAELNTLVAELVMGWCKTTLGKLRPGHTRYPDMLVWDTLQGPYADKSIEDYEPSLWFDWGVISAMKLKGFYLKLQTPFEPGQPYFAAFDQHGVADTRPPWEASADTPALAVCRSALFAILAATPSLPTPQNS